jgi:O-antigen ligase
VAGQGELVHRLLVPAGALLALALVVLRARPTGKRHRIALLTIAGLAFVGLLAHFGSVNPPPEFLVTKPYLWKEVMRLLKGLLLVFVLSRLPWSRESAFSRVLSRGVISLLVLHVLFGMIQYFNLQPIAGFITDVYLEDSPQAGNLGPNAIDLAVFRATGTVYDPNIYANVAVFLGAISLFLFRERRRLQITALVLMFLAIAFSASRTGLAGGIVVTAASVWHGLLYSRRPGKSPLASLTMIAALVLLVPFALSLNPATDRLAFRSSPVQEFLEARWQYDWLLWAVLDNSPLVGFGIGARWYSSADSDFLYLLVQFGLLGLVALIAWYCYLFFGRDRRPEERLFVLLAITLGLTNGVFFGNEIFPFAAILAVGNLSRSSSDLADSRQSLHRQVGPHRNRRGNPQIGARSLWR